VVFAFLLAAVAVVAQFPPPGPQGQNCTWIGPNRHKYDLYAMERWGHQGDYHSAHEGKVYDYSTNLCTSSHVWSCGDLGYTCCQYTRDTFNFQANMGFWAGGQPKWS
jgi:hypothetical protein